MYKCLLPLNKFLPLKEMSSVKLL